MVAKGVLVPNLPLLVLPSKASYDDRTNVLDWLDERITVIEGALAKPQPTPVSEGSA